MAGAPRGLTGPTCRRPKHCEKRWRDKTGVHNSPLQQFAQICQETGKE
jgi:hypothetical protein